MLITPHSTILFQGDSITDAGRSREDLTDLGTGYAALAAAWFTALHPASGVRFLNRGISGNRASDLPRPLASRLHGPQAASGLDLDRHQRHLATVRQPRPDLCRGLRRKPGRGAGKHPLCRDANRSARAIPPAGHGRAVWLAGRSRPQDRRSAAVGCGIYAALRTLRWPVRSRCGSEACQFLAAGWRPSQPGWTYLNRPGLAKGTGSLAGLNPT